MMDNIFKEFFSHQYEEDINIRLLENDYVFPQDMFHNYLSDLIEIDIREYFRWLDEHFSASVLSIDDAVQFSDFHDATSGIVEALLSAGDYGYSYIEIGKKLQNDGISRTEWAYRKYGENHAKTATYLGYLFSINRCCYVSAIGYSLSSFTDTEQMKLFARLFTRTTLFKSIYYLTRSGIVDLRELFDMLTRETYIRRRSSIKKLYKNLILAEPECNEIFKRIDFS